MVCKFCNAEFEEEVQYCPVCGKSVTEDVLMETEETEQQEALDQESAEIENAEPQNVEGDPQSLFEPETLEETKQKKSVAPLVFSIIAAVLALASLATLLMMAMGVDFKSFLPRDNDIFYKEAYTLEDDKAAQKGDAVIATMGSKELTNAQLQIYYRMQVLDFLNYYGTYAQQLGLDVTLPLSQQECYFEEGMTWEQYMLDIAVETWQNYQALALLAEEENFQLTQEQEDSLNELPASLQEQAEESEYENADALLKDVIGPTCTLELYMDYARMSYICDAYYSTLSEKMTPNDEDIAAYFEENKASFEENGITKEMGNIADVRHILICPKGGTEDETTGETVYSDQEWDACLKEAEKILNEWKNGEATEATFSEFANKHTEDTGSATTGGLYEDIAPGASYVENFLNWAIDMNRQKGETGIVKTEYGYHIMYYVDGEPYWISAVGTQLLSERTTKMIDDAEARWPMQVDYRKIAMSELKFS